VDGEFAHAGVDQRQRDGRARPARADQQRALAPGIVALRTDRADEADAVDHFAMPSAIGSPPHQIGRAKKLGAFGRALAMFETGEFVRHRDDDAVEILEPVGRFKEIAEVLDADLNRNQDPVIAALGKGARHAAGRLHLLDRIADDNMKPGRAGQVDIHGEGSPV
jgi:hypothetical protein